MSPSHVTERLRYNFLVDIQMRQVCDRSCICLVCLYHAAKPCHLPHRVQLLLFLRGLAHITHNFQTI
jgi:hypothetical protein